jgi:hypothetical protein
MRTKHNDLFQKRGLAFLVQMRRGGLAREEALRWFETVDREDGTLALGWLITVISGDFRDKLDEDERLQGARRAFARGLDTFVYVPGCKLANALSGHIKTCIKNELTTLVRSKSRKSQGAGDSEISERMTGKTVSDGFDRASSISELLGGGGQISDAEFRVNMAGFLETLEDWEVELLELQLQGKDIGVMFCDELRAKARNWFC